jgi:hypothetical protein
MFVKIKTWYQEQSKGVRFCLHYGFIIITLPITVPLVVIGMALAIVIGIPAQEIYNAYERFD